MTRLMSLRTLVLTAALFGVTIPGAGTAMAEPMLVGPTLLPMYNIPTDNATNVLVVYDPYPFPSAGTVDFLLGKDQPGSEIGSFTAFQLRPLGGSQFSVVADSQTFTPPTVVTPTDVQYTLTTPWTVQAGDLYAHFGNGIPFNIIPPPDGNTPQSVYFPSTAPPVVGTTITLPSTDFPLFGNSAGQGSPGQMRDYGLDAHLVPVVSAVPEPSTLIPAAAASVIGLGFVWRRRRRATA